MQIDYATPDSILSFAGHVNVSLDALEQFPHVRLQGRREFRLRVGDYRVIYEFDPARNELFLITLGHRREVYR